MKYFRCFENLFAQIDTNETQLHTPMKIKLENKPMLFEFQMTIYMRVQLFMFVTGRVHRRCAGKMVVLHMPVQRTAGRHRIHREMSSRKCKHRKKLDVLTDALKVG